jgi:hypothetical protein
MIIIVKYNVNPLIHLLILFLSPYPISEERLERSRHKAALRLQLDVIIGTKTSHHGLNIVGYRRATCAFTKGCNNANWS